VTNTGPNPTRFSLFTQDNLWDVTLEVKQTLTLEPAEQFRFDLEILAPPGVWVGATDTVLLSARNDNDGGSRGFLMLKAKAVPEPGMLVLTVLGGLFFAASWWRRGGNLREGYSGTCTSTRC
jgi:hypothetical protein